MSAKSFQLPYDGHIVQLLAPVDATGSNQSSLVVRMKDYRQAAVLLCIGTAPRAAGVVKIYSCNDMTPSTATSIPFTAFKCETLNTATNGDVFGAAVACTAAVGLVPAAGTPNGVMYLLRFNSSNLVSGDIGFQVVMTNPAASSLCCMVAILSDGPGVDQSVTVTT